MNDDSLAPPTYQELQDRNEFDFVSRTTNWEVYRIKDSIGLFIIFDLGTGDSITLDFDDVPQIFHLVTQINKIQEGEVDSIPPEELGIYD